ncbi:SRPBCC family protein [Gilvibacter sp.]|uniref:SRPBCC family protein n=1 Tax=Gilvibacter sp. TaxID=2729997 RepID=UPI0035BE4A1F
MERKQPNIKATYQIEIDAPIDEVWDALAVDYGGIGKWASGVNHVVEFSGEGADAKRFCSISAAGFNDTREKVIKWDPENYYFEYELYEGLPGFVRYSINKDKLTPKGNKTIWTSYNDMRVGGFMGLTMKWMMRKQLTKVLQNKAEELKHFVETGEAHPRKVEIMEKTLVLLPARIALRSSANNLLVASWRSFLRSIFSPMKATLGLDIAKE